MRQALVILTAALFLIGSASTAHALTEEQAVRTIVGEASNQGLDGMTAVAEVLRRRGTVKGCYGFRAMKDRWEPPAVWNVARFAWRRSAHTDLSHGATLFENVHDFGFPRSWDREHVVCVAQIKDHWFFKEV